MRFWNLKDADYLDVNEKLFFHILEKHCLPFYENWLKAILIAFGNLGSMILFIYAFTVPPLPSFYFSFWCIAYHI